MPNVVYTCGAIRHGERIMLPYAVSDTFANFATIRIPALLNSMKAAAGPDALADLIRSGARRAPRPGPCRSSRSSTRR